MTIKRDDLKPTEVGLSLRAYIQTKKSESLISMNFEKNELVIHTSPDKLIELVTFLKEDQNCAMQQLVDVCGADYPNRPKRFDAVYHFLSLKHNHRVRVKVQLAEGEAVPSLTGLYGSAGWFEREAYDLYGIYFSGHEDLRRILTDYGFVGHPLRKDFPLTGYVEVRYDLEEKRVVYEPVKLRQEFRTFDFESPWEGMTNRIEQDYLLPGDEKASA